MIGLVIVESDENILRDRGEVLVDLPPRNVGEAFIEELARLVNKYINKFESIALMRCAIIFPITLQKRSLKFNCKEQVKYLKKFCGKREIWMISLEKQSNSV